MTTFLLLSMINGADFDENFLQEKINSIQDTYYKKLVEAKYLGFKYTSKTSEAKPSLHFIDYSKENNSSILMVLKEKHPGKIKYLDIWATWCGSCIAKFPYTASLEGKYDSDKFQVIYLAINSKAEAWKKVIKHNKLEGYHYLLNKNQHQELVKELGLSSIPHYFLMDEQGKIIQKSAPRPNLEELNILLKEYLR